MNHNLSNVKLFAGFTGTFLFYKFPFMCNTDVANQFSGFERNSCNFSFIIPITYFIFYYILSGVLIFEYLTEFKLYIYVYYGKELKINYQCIK